MKNGQITLYCPFTKMVKESVTSFQSPELSQEHPKSVCHTAR